MAGGPWSLLFEVTPGQVEQGEYQADDDASGDGEVDLVIFLFDGDVAGEFSEEGNFRTVGYEKAGGDAKNTNEYQELAHGIIFTQKYRRIGLIPWQPASYT